MRFLINHDRLCTRFLRFALLAALAVGVAAVPSRATALAAAQGAAAAQTSAAKTNASQAAPASQATDPEEQEIEGFLHAPAVRSMARTLHLSLEATDNIFLGINFAIIALAIAIPLIRITPKIIRKRTMTLRHNLSSANKLTENAQARLIAVEEQLSQLGGEIDKLRSEMEQELQKDEVRIKGSIEEERARIVAAAEQEINLAGVQARRGLRKFTAELAVKHASEQMALSPETDRALIAEFSASMMKDRDGASRGKNGAGGKS